MLLISPDGVEVPQLGEFQRAGAVAVGFFDLHDDPLEMFRIVIGVVERQGEILLLEGGLVDNRRGAVDAHRIIHARDEKQQTDMRIGLQVLVGLKQFIASHIGNEQMPLVEHTDETRLAALWGGIAMPCLTTGGHNHEWRVADEVLDGQREPKQTE